MKSAHRIHALFMQEDVHYSKMVVRGQFLFVIGVVTTNVEEKEFGIWKLVVADFGISNVVHPCQT